jgi:hypothetical protein
VESRWKSQTTATVDRLKDAVEHLLHHNSLPELAKYDGALSKLRALSEHEPTVHTLSPLSTDHSSSIGPSAGNFTSEGPSAGLRGDQDDSDLVPLPMNNLYNLTDPNNSRLIRVDPTEVNGPDFISQGILSLAEAEFLFGHYRDYINPLLWEGMLCSHKSLDEARQSSSLLVAVVLTVAALHITNREKSLHASYGAFVSLMRGSCLLHSQNLDDIRALCIGAFYLTSLSWALVSRAVRVATELNLHKSSLQFARGSLEQYERVRLWHVLYVCDHQFALAYGRPPLMHEDAAIRNAEKLLTSGLSSKGDRSIVAQVKLFRILASGYFMYGCDPDLELTKEDFEQLQSFNLSVDQWRLEHHHRASDSVSEGTAPNNGNTLYYHLARFQLNSVSLRGISGKGTSQDASKRLGWDRQEAANNAIMAAMSTVRLIVDDTNLQRELVGLPIYTHAMIAVCASFLLKMAVVFGETDATGDRTIYLPRDLAQYGLNFHTSTALTIVQRLVCVLGLVADNASHRHVARQVVTGLGELLQGFSSGQEIDSFTYNQSRGSTASSSASSVVRRPLGGSSSRDALHRDPPGGHISYADVPGTQNTAGLQPGVLERHIDPFDLTGDLDWRFDDGCLLSIDNFDSAMPIL